MFKENILIPNCCIIPKSSWDNFIFNLATKQKISSIENLEFFIIFEDFRGFIFSIPKENLYAVEFIWEGGNEIYPSICGYSEHFNSLLSDLELNFKMYIDITFDSVR